MKMKKYHKTVNKINVDNDGNTYIEKEGRSPSIVERVNNIEIIDDKKLSQSPKKEKKPLPTNLLNDISNSFMTSFNDDRFRP